MCGRYSLATPAQADLRARFALGESVTVERRFNVCPGDEILAVTTDRHGEPRGERLRWGFVPHWAREPGMGLKMINARAETVAEKPAYRDALRTHRCLVVADGFYEWQAGRRGGTKLPWHVTRADGAPFAFAGLWSVWRGAGDQVLRTCTIVTTSANDRLREVHDRMPVMLPDQGAEEAWLAHDTPIPEALTLLAPLPDALTTRRAVGPAVSDARYDGPDCLLDADPATVAAFSEATRRTPSVVDDATTLF
jgi:putative SOS response-associated peptidase YedK